LSIAADVKLSLNNGQQFHQYQPKSAYHNDDSCHLQ